MIMKLKPNTITLKVHFFPYRREQMPVIILLMLGLALGSGCGKRGATAAYGAANMRPTVSICVTNGSLTTAASMRP